MVVDPDLHMSKTFTGLESFATSLKFVRNVGCGLCPKLLKRAVIEFIGDTNDDLKWRVDIELVERDA
jgi:hypothetical protein